MVWSGWPVSQIPMSYSLIPLADGRRRCSNIHSPVVINLGRLYSARLIPPPLTSHTFRLTYSPTARSDGERPLQTATTRLGMCIREMYLYCSGHSIHCYTHSTSSVRSAFNPPGEIKKGIWYHTVQMRSEAFGSAFVGTRSLQALFADCQMWKRFRVRRLGPWGSIRFHLIQALPSLWKLTQGFLDEGNRQDPVCYIGSRIMSPNCESGTGI